MISVSIVSHRHGELVADLLSDLQRCCAEDIHAILTLNVPEAFESDRREPTFPLEVVRNGAPRGFAANHNAAFRASRGEYFCVLNPDIRMATNPFPVLVEVLRDPRVAVAAPVVHGPDGDIEDSARCFPTPATLLRKLAGGRPRLDYSLDAPVIRPDWVAGMFMLFRRETFAALGGFDEGYFLYYEDVDLCARARSQGLDVVLVTGVSVIHHARRASHRNLRHSYWHARSALRYFAKVRSLRLTGGSTSSPPAPP